MSTAPTTCDLLIHSGDVIDGTGSARAHLDVAVTGDRVVAVGEHLDLHVEATSKVDASGLVVVPGFIDAHTHDDRAVLSGPDMTPKISQGVTSVVTGNCGASLAPFAGREPPPPMNLLGDASWYRFPTMREYMAAVEVSPPALNLAPLVGHTALRAATMDDVYRAATASEITHMEALLDEALAAGCIGMSTGLAYPPAVEAPTDEVVTLASRLGAYHGIYATHMRDEGAGVLDSVRETLEIGERAGVPVVISHHKCSGRESWGLSRDTLAAIARARAKQSVDLDVYPYVASSTVLLAEWIAGAERVLVTWSAPHPECKGRDFESIRCEWGCTLEEAVERLSPAGAIYFKMDEEDLQPHPALPGRDDRLRRSAPRRLPPPAAVGHVSQSARSLLPRARSVLSRGGGPSHDRRAGARLRSHRPGHGPGRCSSRTSCSSTPRTGGIDEADFSTPTRLVRAGSTRSS